MVSTPWILKPKFCRQCTLQKHEHFGNYNRIAPANLSSYTYPCLTVWVDKKAGNVGAQSGSNSISVVQRMWTQGLSLWRLVWSHGWCLEIWGCPRVSSGEPELPVCPAPRCQSCGEEIHVSTSNKRTLIWTLFFLSIKTTKPEDF